MKQVALLIAVNAENQILLQHKDAGAPNFPNTWCMFGGQVEEGETTREALQRELIEELEWELGNVEYLTSHDSDGVHREAFLVHTDRTVQSLRMTQHEGDDLDYFFREDIATLSVAPPHFAMIETYFKK